jgi:hypothetical protein
VSLIVRGKNIKMTIPDFDNFQKWLNWFKERSWYKIWLILPIIFLGIIGLLVTQNSSLKNDLRDMEKEIIPIKELYPKLELSAAVAKLMGDYNLLKGEITKFQQKEEQKNYKPLTSSRQEELTTALHELVQKYPGLNLNLWIYCVKPSTDQFKKVNELLELFNDANIPTKYSNTIMSATTDLFLVYNPDLNRELISDVAEILKIVFLIDRVPVKADDDNDDRLLELFFLGDPLFDNEGRIFY